MRRKLTNLLAWIGGLFLFGLLGTIVIGFLFAGQNRVPDRVIISVDFRNKLVEYIPDNLFAQISQARVLGVRDVVEALEKASKDERVKGLFARVGGIQMGIGEIQEVRDAVLAFRKFGKPSVAYAETFGDFGMGIGSYYLASAFEEVFLQPSGNLGLTGLAYEHPFIKGTLEKLGLIPRMSSRYEYKNAVNLFTEKSFTDAHREATEGLLASHFDQITSGISKSLSISISEVKELMDQGPFLAEEAMKIGLVTGVVYKDEVIKKIKEIVGQETEFLSLKTYLERVGRPNTKGEVVALIYGVGPIGRGKSDYDLTSGDLMMGSDSVTEAFQDAVKDDEVKAILFRVNSPGGSYVASDAIWRQTLLAKKAGKPVIVSMGNVAGSGGYFIAMGGDKIVAQPGTITGSIGVYAGKMLTSQFWEKLGVSWDEVHLGQNSTMWTGTKDFTTEQWTQFQAWLDWVYNDFTRKVAIGRNLQAEQVFNAARGRVWTGQDALALGLVDTLGGISTALDLTREAIGLPEDAPLELQVFPKEKSFIELVLEQGMDIYKGQVAVNRVIRFLDELQPITHLARVVSLGQKKEVLRMPEVNSVLSRSKN